MSIRFMTAAMAVGGAVLLTACDQREPTVYTVPKEVASNETDTGTPMPPDRAVPPASQAMVNQSLPAGALNAGGEAPTWEPAPHWSTGIESAMRRGSYRITGTAGEGDISVTTFPGDVGGLLANINRWRGQVDLAPIRQNEVAQYITSLNINGKEATLVELEGPQQGTVTAIFEHGGNSWFFRITGPNALVTEERDAFLGFLQSVHFPHE